MFILLLLLCVGQIESTHFFKDFHTTGFISLPYAEIKEPFEAWYSATHNKSRIDYYGGMVKNVVDVKGGATYKISPMTNEHVTNVNTCFKTSVREGEVISPQSVLPDMSLFSEQGTEVVNGYVCNKWVFHKYPLNTTHLDMVYTLYVYGDSFPMKFVMKGYNIISGSHVDEYIIDYTTFEKGDGISDAVFSPYQGMECGGYPGPGHAGQAEDTFSELISGVHHHESNFKQYKEKYNKNYISKDEHLDRYRNFVNNVRYINSKNKQGLSYKLGVNHLADWYPHEHARLRGRIYSGVANGGEPYMPDTTKYRALPTDFDLRLEGAIGAVKDQAVCGSCWSFATTGSIEGAFYNKYGYRISLSEQNLMDCSWGYGNNGCDGGEEWRAYEWVIKHGGIMFEEDYGQYLMADGRCHYNRSLAKVEIDGYQNVTSGDQAALKYALFHNGAVAVNIDASHKSLSFYQSGVYYEPLCKNSDMDLDHAVLAVGWGSLGGEDYWIIKNSWSTHWGNVGYVLMSRRDNNCGVATGPTVVLVK